MPFTRKNMRHGNKIYKSFELPFTLIDINEWRIITVSGEDSKKYLQTQLTTDILKKKKTSHILTAHCNAKGKVWGVLRILYYKEHYICICHKSVRDIHLQELRKYAIFSKVKIESNSGFSLLGIAGLNAKEKLSQIFPILPDVNKLVVNDTYKVIILNTVGLITRYIIIATSPTVKKYIKNIFYEEAVFHHDMQWLFLDIESGIPVIEEPNKNRFLPQAINLEDISGGVGISFKKGCYNGQEMIAKTKFRGLNKSRLYYLLGKSGSFPQVGENLEVKNNQGFWKSTGTITAVVHFHNKNLAIQAVLKKEILNTYRSVQIRISKDDSSILKVQRLIYSPEKVVQLQTR